MPPRHQRHTALRSTPLVHHGKTHLSITRDETESSLAMSHESRTVGAKHLRDIYMFPCLLTILHFNHFLRYLIQYILIHKPQIKSRVHINRSLHYVPNVSSHSNNCSLIIHHLCCAANRTSGLNKWRPPRCRYTS